MSGAIALAVTDSNPDARVVGMFLNNKARRSEHTARVYNSELTRFTELIKKPLQEVTLEDLQTYADSLNHLAAASQARALTTVRSLFKFATRIGFLRWNPAEVLELPKVEITSEQRYLTKDEVAALIRQSRVCGPTAQLAVSVMVLTGLRIGELTKIEWKDFYADVHGNIGLTVKGKGGKIRPVKMRPDLWAMVLGHRSRLGLSCELDAQDKTPLFKNRRGGAMSDRYLRRLVTQCASNAGIKKKVSPHWLRHTACTLAILGGAELQQVQEDFGHASINTTMRYLHSVKQLEKTSTDYIQVDI